MRCCCCERAAVAQPLATRLASASEKASDVAMLTVWGSGNFAAVVGVVWSEGLTGPRSCAFAALLPALHEAVVGRCEGGGCRRLPRDESHGSVRVVGDPCMLLLAVLVGFDPRSCCCVLSGDSTVSAVWRSPPRFAVGAMFVVLLLLPCAQNFLGFAPLDTWRPEGLADAMVLRYCGFVRRAEETASRVQEGRCCCCCGC